MNCVCGRNGSMIMNKSFGNSTGISLVVHLQWLNKSKQKTTLTFSQHVTFILTVAEITIGDLHQTLMQWVMFMSCFYCKNMGCFDFYKCCAKSM